MIKEWELEAVLGHGEATESHQEPKKPSTSTNSSPKFFQRDQDNYLVSRLIMEHDKPSVGDGQRAEQFCRNRTSAKGESPQEAMNNEHQEKRL